MKYLSDVVTLKLNEEKCIGCGQCLIVCPHDVFAMNGSSAAIRDRDACMECGACALNCPTEAVTVQAGVGCAAAIINSFLGITGSDCCCLENTANPDGVGVSDKQGRPKTGACCC